MLFLHTCRFISNDARSHLVTNHFILYFRAIVAYVAYFNCHVGGRTVSLQFGGTLPLVPRGIVSP